MSSITQVFSNYGITGAKGDGVSDDSAAIQAAAANYKELWIPSEGRLFIGSSITVSSDITFISGGQFIVGTGITLTLNGRIKAPLAQCFVIQGSGSIQLGTANSEIPAEWFGAVGDWNGTSGTDNTTALQNCLNAITRGQMLLQGKLYRTSATLSITRSMVGILGSPGTNVVAAASGFPISGGIVCTSASADIVQCWGASTSAAIFGNRFENLSISRSLEPTGTAAGLSLMYAGAALVRNVQSGDSVRCFYLVYAAAYGTGEINSCQAYWGFNGFTVSGNLFGFYLDATTTGPTTTRIKYCTVANGSSGTTYGLYLIGGQICDVMCTDFETSKSNYGIYITYQGGTSFINPCTDIHLRAPIIDEIGIAGIYITGLDYTTGMVEIDGGWVCAHNGSAIGIEIVNSTGVTIRGTQFQDSGSVGRLNNGLVASGSSNIAMTGCNISSCQTSAITLTNCTQCAITGNVIRSNSGNRSTATAINLVGSSRNGITSNCIDGYATTGLSLDSASGHNSIIGTNLINPTNITTPVSDAGSNNNKVP